MANSMLCGDEVCAAVADIGSLCSRFGIAGQDTPRHIFRSDIGRRAGDPSRSIVGDSALRAIIEDMEIGALSVNGHINWDSVESILRYGVFSALHLQTSEAPMLLTDSLLSTPKEKEEMLELCIESLLCPAVYLAPTAMLSAFSTARPTALVIEMGNFSTRVRPVVDGYGLRKAYLETQRGGAYIDRLLQQRIEGGIEVAGATSGQLPIELVPQYECLAKKNSPSLTRNIATESYRRMMVRDLAIDIKKWMCFIPYKPLPAENRSTIVASLPIPSFELPDGNLVAPRDNICTIPEEIWFSNRSHGSVPEFGRKRARDILPDPQIWQDSVTLPELVYQSLLRCDTDVRRELCANVVVCCGGGLIDGISQRLSHDMTGLLPSSVKFKIASQLPVEKANSAWIGGSILSICGAFQQLWVSRGDYLEHGAANIVREKFIQ